MALQYVHVNFFLCTLGYLEQHHSFIPHYISLSLSLSQRYVPVQAQCVSMFKAVYNHIGFLFTLVLMSKRQLKPPSFTICTNHVDCLISIMYIIDNIAAVRPQNNPYF